MMTGALLRTWKHIKHHVPLIKFRKGGPVRESTAGSVTHTPAPSRPGQSGTPPSKSEKLPVIEDWQLPPHYQRSKLDEREINAINSGGAY